MQKGGRNVEIQGLGRFTLVTTWFAIVPELAQQQLAITKGN